MSMNQKFQCFFKKIGERLKSDGVLTDEQINIVLNYQKTSNKLFGQIARKLNFITEDYLLTFLSKLYHIDIVSLDFIYIPLDVLLSLDFKMIELYNAVPFYKDENEIKIAISDPGNVLNIDKLKKHFGDLKINLFLARESQITKIIEQIKYRKLNITEDNLDENPLFVLNSILFDSLEKRASDIHLEPYENFVKVRVRVDGILSTIRTISLETYAVIKSKLKIISNLNITENRRPQSGHTRIYLAGKTVDMRISSHPGILGENFVIRIFDLSNGIKKLNALGFLNQDLLWLQNMIHFPAGLFLIIGPTGSGKTTTLYSLLQEINSQSMNIMTLEDPVEYQIEGIKQLDLKEEGILSFSDGVKSILRQDPDVLLIGEIRDEETAACAIRASLTGRLVLATIHASNTLDGVRRFLDLGVNFSDVITSLIGLFSQKLVRKLNKNCAFDDTKYLDRLPICEYVYMSEELKTEILKTNNIYEYKHDRAFKDSIEQFLIDNITDIDEIKRVFGNVYI